MILERSRYRGDLDRIEVEAEATLDGPLVAPLLSLLPTVALIEVGLRRGDTDGIETRLDELDAACDRSDEWLVRSRSARLRALVLAGAQEVVAAEVAAHRGLDLALDHGWLAELPALLGTLAVVAVAVAVVAVVAAVVAVVAVVAAVVAVVADVADDSTLAARLAGVATAWCRRRQVATVVLPPPFTTTVARVRGLLGGPTFDGLVEEAGRLSDDEALAFVRRARGERRRPAAGWDSLAVPAKVLAAAPCSVLLVDPSGSSPNRRSGTVAAPTPG